MLPTLRRVGIIAMPSFTKYRANSGSSGWSIAMVIGRICVSEYRRCIPELVLVAVVANDPYAQSVSVASNTADGS
jgi:hypothetical protein